MLGADQTAPDGYRRIVWTIIGMIKAHPTDNRMALGPGSARARRQSTRRELANSTGLEPGSTACLMRWRASWKIMAPARVLATAGGSRYATEQRIEQEDRAPPIAPGGPAGCAGRHIDDQGDDGQPARPLPSSARTITHSIRTAQEALGRQCHRQLTEPEREMRESRRSRKLVFWNAREARRSAGPAQSSALHNFARSV
jgi:hypothetical protein